MHFTNVNAHTATTALTTRVSMTATTKPGQCLWSFKLYNFSQQDCHVFRLCRFSVRVICTAISPTHFLHCSDPLFKSPLSDSYNMCRYSNNNNDNSCPDENGHSRSMFLKFQVFCHCTKACLYFSFPPSNSPLIGVSHAYLDTTTITTTIITTRTTARTTTITATTLATRTWMTTTTAGQCLWSSKCCKCSQ